ncbi:MAG: nitronate monooxygenase [Flavobacteriaceae bacterium]|mgnify:FL=1|jgi:nitronate monooxygenase|nr:nitronate monooxygenase [Flavobacteriaceae bacterium]MBT4246757.1 nitronate monooxygenase [Flavobacteriaceae bacterium]MBT5012276.1 nitronate monooxygenase [Flavobacteriaceae bacterium]MBT7011029.1 nitronate monooxygenase [Flavobacteriaceae bacterium]MBT7320294.1 nitronate monooxygenase [Flavobacteriaceae bacterium]|tara:strand:+ start:112 stop:1077 length:966 start_codon:yes stop_codon:yes gene_type:complete
MGENTKTFLKDTGASIPVVCGPMYPGSNPELIAAVSEAGGFGVVQPLSLTSLYGHDFREGLRLIKSLTDKPFGVNFTIFGGGNKKYHDNNKKWMDISIEEGVKFFLTSLGKPTEIVKIAKKNDIKVYHDVPNKKVALAMVDCGVDGLNCINWRAGGQTGIYSAEKFMEDLKDIKIPLICAGGIGNENDYKKALEMGYSGVQLGTRFLASKECIVTKSYKNAIVNSEEKDIVWTNKIAGNNSSVIKTKDIMRGGLRTGPIINFMLRRPKLKKYARMYLMSKGLKSYSKTAFDDSVQFWQAGKGVGGIKSIESCADILKNYKI